MSLFNKEIVATAFVLAGLSATVPARAETFNYSGNSFNVINDPFLGKSVIASLTFGNGVTNNYTGILFLSSAASFIISSGSLYITNSNNSYNYGQFNFLNGTISSWIFEVKSASGVSEILTNSSGRDFVSGGNGVVNYIEASPGTWTQASVSVPGPVAGSGLPVLLVLGGVAVAARSRKNMALTFV